MEEKKLTGYPSIDKPWLKYYSEEAIHAPLPEGTIYEYLWENNKEHLDDVALIYFGKKITYRELFTNIDKTASGFASLGVKCGDIVAIALPNIPENIYCVYALNKLGAIADLIDLRSKGESMLHYLNESKASVCVICNLFAQNIFEILPQTNIENVIICSPFDSMPAHLRVLLNLKQNHCLPDSAALWSNFTSKHDHITQQKNNSDVACILHTSGTTGVPKGVMLTNRNFNAMVIQYSLCGLEIRIGDKFLSQVPPFLAYSVIIAIHLPLALHMQVRLLPNYEPHKFAKNIMKYKPNHTAAGPADWNNFLQNRSVKFHNFDYLRTIGSGSDALLPKNKLAINKLLQERGCKFSVIEGYGMTEVGSSACTNLPQCDEIGSVGIPLPKTTFCIFDNEKNQELSYDETGEICITGPTLMKGYYNDQSATDEILRRHSDGIVWLHSGDLGRMNKDGFVTIEGRIKRIIVRHDGIKVSPYVLENVIMKSPAVSECCVVGADDKEHQMGKVPVAFIVITEPYETAIEEIQKMCKRELSENYIPHKYIKIDALPLTPNGKVDYRTLEHEAQKD